MTDSIDEQLARLDRLDREASRLLGDLGPLDEHEAANVVDAHRRAVSLLEDYRERATGSGDFGGYVEFRSKFSSFVEELDDDLAQRDAFEQALEHVERRRLSDRDFDLAMDALEPADTIASTLEELQSVREERRDVRHDLVEARRQLSERQTRLADLSDIQSDALDTSVDQLREPVERFNDGVSDEFQSFIRDTPIVDVLRTNRRLSYFALLDIEAPPPPLETYLSQHDVGTDPLPTIREYLSYSRSKLDHYVDDAGRFLSEVGHHRDYLDRLTPAPYQIDWPPPARDRFLWQLRELQQAVHRFASAETVEALRELQSLCRDRDRFERLRSAARLQQELDETERDLVVSGAIHDELEAVTTDLEAIDAALDATG